MQRVRSQTMEQPPVPAPGDRPDVEVLVDGTWWPGELRAWERRDDGWWGNVQWRTKPGETRIDTLPEHRIRPDTWPADVRRPVGGDA